MDTALVDLALSPSPQRHLAQVLDAVVSVARRRTSMDVAFVVQIQGQDQVVRAVDGDADSFAAEPGTRRSLDETYCGLLLRGELQPLVRDTAEDPAVSEHPATRALGVRGYIGMPVRYPDGKTFGVLACASRQPASWLTQPDLFVLSALADVVSIALTTEQSTWAERCRDLDESRQLIEGSLSINYQPIVDLRTGRPCGVEALARFPATDAATDVCFRRAWSTGYGADLELRAIATAVKALGALPEQMFLTLNISPQLPADPRFFDLLQGLNLERLVVELTEHSRMDDPPKLRAQLQPLRDRGLRLAVDDAGAGYSGLNRILDLAPDFIKLDVAIARTIDDDPTRQALVRSLVHFADQIGAALVAEGLEMPAQLEELKAVGIQLGQGYLLGRPAPLQQLRLGS